MLDPTYRAVLTGGLAFAALTFVAGLFVRTPYGRFASRRMGPQTPIRLGWLLMEAPAVIAFFAVYALGDWPGNPVALCFAAIWAIHYGNRAVAFPLLMRPRPDSAMAASVWVIGMGVTTVHGWLYASWLTWSFDGLREPWSTSWFVDPRFVIGVLLWAVGFGLIVSTESILRSLRDATRRDDRGYSIQFGGGYRWVSSPHYLGEILAFTGLMIATWCPGGLFVWAVTLANLVPRAAATHRWYRERFPEYPAARRALVPGVW